MRRWNQLHIGACGPQGTTYSQAQLLAASSIQSDLGALASAGAGENLTVPVFINDTRGGVRLTFPVSVAINPLSPQSNEVAHLVLSCKSN